MNKLAIEILKSVKSDCDRKLETDLTREKRKVLKKASLGMAEIIAEFVEIVEK